MNQGENITRISLQALMTIPVVFGIHPALHILLLGLQTLIPNLAGEDSRRTIYPIIFVFVSVVNSHFHIPQYIYFVSNVQLFVRILLSEIRRNQYIMRRTLLRKLKNMGLGSFIWCVLDVFLISIFLIHRQHLPRNYIKSSLVKKSPLNRVREDQASPTRL